MTRGPKYRMTGSGPINNDGEGGIVGFISHLIFAIRQKKFLKTDQEIYKKMPGSGENFSYMKDEGHFHGNFCFGNLFFHYS